MIIPFFPRIVKCCATLIFAASISYAGDWPTLRGPDQTGMSQETGFKTEGDVKTLWTVTVGLGHSAVTVADGLAYVTGHDGENTGSIYCYDAVSGEEKWKFDYENPLDPNSYAGGTTGSVAIYDGLAYHLARRGLLSVLDAKTGDVKWTKHIQEEYEVFPPDWGFTGVPVVDGDMLILAAGEAGMVLSKADGSLIHKSGKEAGYSTPFLFEKGGEKLAIVSYKTGYKCIVPATGKVYWDLRWMTRYGVNATEPVIDGDYIFISTGYGKGATLLKWSGPGTGDYEQLWKSREMKNQMNPSILVDGFLYGIDGNERQDKTGLKCLEMLTGETQWLDESLGHGAMTIAGDQILAVSEKGEFKIGPVSKEGFEPTLTMKAIEGKVWTIPVLANGIVYLRNELGKVVALDLRK